MTLIEAEILAPLANDDNLESECEISLESEGEDDAPLGVSSLNPINFSQSSRRVIDLHRAYRDDKDLDPRPSFQRGYVWDPKKASKLIESILLNVPLPLVYTAVQENGKEVVIDGQQRLTTCFAFIEGFFPLSKKDEESEARGQSVRRRPFRLTKLKILAELEGKNFSELSDDMKTLFKHFQIPIIKISKDSHPDVKFEIFERLNTGSVSLADQELRNCIYRGTYNNLINELAKNQQFQTIIGANNPVARMQDIELVLRFLAFNEVTHLNYDGRMRSFLNTHMSDNRDVSSEKSARFRTEFDKAISLVYSVFGEKAFRRFSIGSQSKPNGGWEKAINKAVYDVIMFWFARQDKNTVMRHKDEIREKFIDLCSTNREFIDAITLGTADKSRVQTRFKVWENALASILGNAPRERRLFTLEEKTRLFDANPTCEICHQRIELLDDAEVDHAKPFSLGGRTTPDNAKLSHRYCNRAKGARNGA